MAAKQKPVALKAGVSSLSPAPTSHTVYIPLWKDGSRAHVGQPVNSVEEAESFLRGITQDIDHASVLSAELPV